jgi:hypothetical protein
MSNVQLCVNGCCLIGWLTSSHLGDWGRRCMYSRLVLYAGIAAIATMHTLTRPPVCASMALLLSRLSRFYAAMQIDWHMACRRLCSAC